MHVSVSPFYTISLSVAALSAAPADVYLPALRAEARPTRRTVAQLHRDLGRSRYTGADLRRIRADPHRAECSRRRVVAAIREVA